MIAHFLSFNDSELDWEAIKKCLKRQYHGGSVMIPVEVLAIQKEWCGCGEPELAWDAIKKYLRDRQDWADAHPDARLPYYKPLDGRDYILAYLLDRHGLTEHGGSVGGCWPTTSGREVLKFLEEAQVHISELVDEHLENHSEG